MPALLRQHWDRSMRSVDSGHHADDAWVDAQDGPSGSLVSKASALPEGMEGGDVSDLSVTHDSACARREAVPASWQIPR